MPSLCKNMLRAQNHMLKSHKEKWFPGLVRPVFLLSSHFTVHRDNISGCKGVMAFPVILRWFLPLSLFFQTKHTHNTEWVSGDSTQRNGVMLLGTQFHISFWKKQTSCESSLVQTSRSDGDVQVRVRPAVILLWQAVMGFHRHKGKEGKRYLTSAINLDAWVEDSNAQIGSVFVYPVLQRKRRRVKERTSFRINIKS